MPKRNRDGGVPGELSVPEVGSGEDSEGKPGKESWKRSCIWQLCH